MKAVRFTLNTKKLELVEIPLPELTEPDDVLVKVAFSGICGTDLHIMQGEFPVTSDRPLTLGHEYSGTVVYFGPSVKDLKEGDRVAIDPNGGCHCCNFCRSGNFHYCMDTDGGNKTKIGTFKDGGWAEYAVASRNQVHVLPNTIDLQQAALIEPLSCLTHGWDVVSPITVGQNVLVMGAGIIGNLWVCALHHQGHRNVTVSEPNPHRLKLLKKLDTGYKLITPDQLQTAPDQLYDLVVDCSGYAPAIEQAVDLVQKGGTLCCFGVAPTEAEIRIKPFDIFMRELKIYGIKVNPYSFPKAIGLMEAMGRRYMEYEKLGITTFSLDEYKEAIETLEKGGIAKAVFKF